MLLRSSLALLAAALLAAIPNNARACGGFFCNNAQPVNQAAERIIFSRNDDGTTTAVIQILYSGPSEEFAWMLPVQGSPEIGVSSNTAFANLQAATDPQYTTIDRIEGVCDTNDDLFGSLESADPGMAVDAGTAAPPPVSVVDEGSVGPYDFVIISVDAGAGDIAAVATDWLNENDYDVSPLGRDRLVPYLESGMNLLAFRLTKGRDAGEIRPVTLSFGEGLPSIPLRPTAAAATPDMGILVWVIGESRSIPANYVDLHINEALIDWVNWFGFFNGGGYADLVTHAANEAGGQGFVTEFSGDSAPLEDRIFGERERNVWEGIRSRTEFSDHGQLVRDLSSQYGRYEGMRDVVLAEVPKPADLSDEEWEQGINGYLFDLGPVIEGFDPSAFIARVGAEVIDPLADTAALFRGVSKTTRFYTTMSADEMTVDPIFDFNAELGDYSNVHTAERVIECAPNVSLWEASWRITLDDGTVIRGSGNANWPHEPDSLPANTEVLRVGPLGQGTVITDNREDIARAIAARNADFPRSQARSSDCAAGGSGGCAALFLFALAAIRRRRA